MTGGKRPCSPDGVDVPHKMPLPVQGEEPRARVHANIMATAFLHASIRAANSAEPYPEELRSAAAHPDEKDGLE